MIDIKNIPEITDAEIAFGGADKYLPDWKEVPEMFHHGHTKWNKLFNDWFFLGLEKMEIELQEGIDGKKAGRLISALMGSFGSKHEHKEAGVAYLMSLFFMENSTWTPRKPKGREAAVEGGKK